MREERAKHNKQTTTGSSPTFNRSPAAAPSPSPARRRVKPRPLPPSTSSSLPAPLHRHGPAIVSLTLGRRRPRAQRASRTNRRRDFLDRLLIEVGDERAFVEADQEEVGLAHSGRVEGSDEWLVLRFGRTRRRGRTRRTRSELCAERGGFFLDCIEARDEACAAWLVFFEVGASRLRAAEGKVAAPARKAEGERDW